MVVTVALYAISVAVALAITAVLVLALGHSPWTVVTSMLHGSLGNAGRNQTFVPRERRNGHFRGRRSRRKI